MNTIENNCISFGMRYKNPEKWGRKTLQALMDSQLKIDIDKKYPNAYASYTTKTKRASSIFERKESCHFMNFKLKLEKGKTWEYHNSTLNSKELLDDMFAKKIHQMNLNSVEQDIKKEIDIKLKHAEYIKKAKEENNQHKTNLLTKIIEFFK